MEVKDTGKINLNLEQNGTTLAQKKFCRKRIEDPPCAFNAWKREDTVSAMLDEQQRELSKVESASDFAEHAGYDPTFDPPPEVQNILLENLSAEHLEEYNKTHLPLQKKFIKDIKRISNMSGQQIIMKKSPLSCTRSEIIIVEKYLAELAATCTPNMIFNFDDYIFDVVRHNEHSMTINAIHVKDQELFRQRILKPREEQIIILLYKFLHELHKAVDSYIPIFRWCAGEFEESDIDQKEYDALAVWYAWIFQAYGNTLERYTLLATDGPLSLRNFIEYNDKKVNFKWEFLDFERHIKIMLHLQELILFKIKIQLWFKRLYFSLMQMQPENFETEYKSCTDFFTKEQERHKQFQYLMANHSYNKKPLKVIRSRRPIAYLPKAAQISLKQTKVKSEETKNTTEDFLKHSVGHLDSELNTTNGKLKSLAQEIYTITKNLRENASSGKEPSESGIDDSLNESKIQEDTQPLHIKQSNTNTFRLCYNPTGSLLSDTMHIMNSDLIQMEIEGDKSKIGQINVYGSEDNLAIFKQHLAKLIAFYRSVHPNGKTVLSESEMLWLSDQISNPVITTRDNDKFLDFLPKVNAAPKAFTNEQANFYNVYAVRLAEFLELETKYDVTSYKTLFMTTKPKDHSPQKLLEIAKFFHEFGSLVKKHHKTMIKKDLMLQYRFYDLVSYKFLHFDGVQTPNWYRWLKFIKIEIERAHRKITNAPATSQTQQEELKPNQQSNPSANDGHLDNNPYSSANIPNIIPQTIIRNLEDKKKILSHVTPTLQAQAELAIEYSRLIRIQFKFIKDKFILYGLISFLLTHENAL